MIETFWIPGEPSGKGDMVEATHPVTGKPYMRLKQERIIGSVGGWVTETYWDGHRWHKFNAGQALDAWMPLPPAYKG